MTSERSYRTAYTAAQALAEIRRGAGAQFDPAVVSALERCVVRGLDEAGPQLHAVADSA
jgi:HD-GYP domain-containing protein (c-di-GMP phosphodiesterase class II)